MANTREQRTGYSCSLNKSYTYIHTYIHTYIDLCHASSTDDPVTLGQLTLAVQRYRAVSPQGASCKSKPLFGPLVSHRHLVVSSATEVPVSNLAWRWIIAVLNELAFGCICIWWEYTSLDPTNAQNPEASAEKIYTRPVSLMRMPKQTSAPHILLYSKDFFIRLVLRRSRFWRIDFLLLGLGFSDSFGRLVPILESSMVPMPSLYICIYD
jgi:hypothetical protein